MRIIILILLSLYLIPAPYSIAASLEKYYEPRQSYTVPQTRMKEVPKKTEKDFSAPGLAKENRVDKILKGLKSEEREEWLEIYRQRMNEANSEEERLYYRGILKRWGKIK